MAGNLVTAKHSSATPLPLKTRVHLLNPLVSRNSRSKHFARDTSSYLINLNTSVGPSKGRYSMSKRR